MQRSPQPNVRVRHAAVDFSLRFWLLVLVTGVGAGLGGGLLMKILHAAQHFCWNYQHDMFLEAVRHTSAVRHVVVLLIAGILAGAGRLLLRRTTGGHGGEIAQTIWFQGGRFPTLRTLGSAVLSVTLVGMGSSLGREGALKQAGAAVASRLAQWFRLSPSEHRLLAACGAGAGMAAAYNVPLGGALFALEVLLGDLTLPLVLPALGASCVATWVSWLLLPDRPTYNVPTYYLTLPQLLWAVPAAPLLGLAAALWVRAAAWADGVQPHGWRRIVPPMLVFTALGLTAIEFPQLLGNGKDTVQLAFNDELGVGLLLALPLLKLAASAGCLASGAPGGLFTPTICYGAVLGGLLGYGWSCFWPGAPLGSYAILGAGGVLAAATQGPVSALVLLFELTWWTGPLFVPLLLVVVGASLAARRLETRSIYSARIQGGKAAAILGPAPSTEFDDLLARDCAVVSAAARYGELVPALLGPLTAGRPAYVLDQQGRLVGQLTLASISQAKDLAIPRGMAAAEDLAQPAKALGSSLSRGDVELRLRETDAAELPVIDAVSQRLVGVIRRPRGWAEEA